MSVTKCYLFMSITELSIVDSFLVYFRFDFPFCCGVIDGTEIVFAIGVYI
jgi:hypothetical protein